MLVWSGVHLCGIASLMRCIATPGVRHGEYDIIGRLPGCALGICTCLASTYRVDKRCQKQCRHSVLVDEFLRWLNGLMMIAGLMMTCGRTNKDGLGAYNGQLHDDGANAVWK